MKITATFFILAISSLHSSSASPLPPKILYHFGSKQHLIQNAQAGNISLHDWQNYIVGEKTNYDLAPHRRGFYGGEELSDVNVFGGYKVGSGNIPWINIIELNQKCLNPKSVSEGETELFSSSSRFVKWLSSDRHYPSSRKFLSACKETLTEGMYLLNWAEYSATQKSCSFAIQRFYLDSKIKIVNDNAFRKSWYILDRSCIKNIKGTALDVLALMAESQDLDSDFSMAGVWMIVSAFTDMLSGHLEIPAKHLANLIRHATNRCNDSTIDPEEACPKSLAATKHLVELYRECKNRDKLLQVLTAILNEFSKPLHGYSPGGDWSDVFGWQHSNNLASKIEEIRGSDCDN